MGRIRVVCICMCDGCRAEIYVYKEVFRLNTFRNANKNKIKPPVRLYTNTEKSFYFIFFSFFRLILNPELTVPLGKNSTGYDI